MAETAPISVDDRIAVLLQGRSPGGLRLAIRHRYLAMALAINTPGNSIIGGGGGIMMLAGPSRSFTPLPTFLTVVLAVSPVPLAVAFPGLRL